MDETAVYDEGVIEVLANADHRHILYSPLLESFDHHSRTIIEDWKTT